MDTVYLVLWQNLSKANYVNKNFFEGLKRERANRLRCKARDDEPLKPHQSLASSPLDSLSPSPMPELETTPNPNPSAPSLCEECGLNPWKYRCPGCSIRTCALPCVKAHKQRTSCTGKRSRAEPIPISQFNDDLLLSGFLSISALSCRSFFFRLL